MSELGEESLCTESLLEILAQHGNFSPIPPRKRMAQGEGLTKIWMCPSSEMAEALFSSGQNKERKEWAQPSLNIMEKLVGDRKHEPESSLASKDKDTSGLPHDNKDAESVGSMESLGSYYEGGSSTQTVSAVISSPSPSVESLTDERLEKIESKLKQRYRDRLADGAQLLLTFSLRSLDARIYSLVREIREEEQIKISEQLKPVFDFIKKYEVAVGRENGVELKRKYKLQRRECIERLVNSEEESFTFLLVQVQKDYDERFQLRVSKLRNEYHFQYKEDLRSEIRKLVNRFKEECASIAKNHEEAINQIREKYKNKYRELKTAEMDQARKKYEAIKTAMKEAQEVGKKGKGRYEVCSEVSGWLCILQQLLTDLEIFIKSFISSELDIRRLLLLILKQRQPQQLKEKSRWVSSIKDSAAKNLAGEAMGSLESVPCIPGRNEALHRVLLKEASAILKAILSDISKGLVVGTHYKGSVTLGSSNGHTMVARPTESDEEPSYYNLFRLSEVEDTDSGSIYSVFAG